MTRTLLLCALVLASHIAHSSPAEDFPEGQVLPAGKDTYKVRVAGAPIQVLDPRANRLMRNFCKTMNKAVVVKDTAYEGDSGLRYTFSCGGGDPPH
jgi:hypothetical protein